jgi:hypothetical protein
MCNREGMSKIVEAEESKVSAVIEQADDTETPKPPTWLKRAISIYWMHEFLVLMVVVILVAKAYPPLGAEYLQPKITAKWIAVIFIFGAFWNCTRLTFRSDSCALSTHTRDLLLLQFWQV